jgi:nucleotide-binding universal stress UspA family protein
MKLAIGITATSRRGDAAPRGRRVLAVLECRASDDAVLERAVEVAERPGGYLTLVVVVPTTPSWFYCGPYCVPRVAQAELRAHALDVLARATASIRPEIPLITAVETGRVGDVIARRVEAAAHDLVIVRRRRATLAASARSGPVPVLAVAH